MDNLELANYLDKRGIHYVINNEILIITNLNEDLDLKMLFTLSGKVIFENDGRIALDHLKRVTGELTFYNRGDVCLRLLKKNYRIVFGNEGLTL